mgnify:CR=1 FL=1
MGYASEWTDATTPGGQVSATDGDFCMMPCEKCGTTAGHYYFRAGAGSWQPDGHYAPCGLYCTGRWIGIHDGMHNARWGDKWEPFCERCTPSLWAAEWSYV